MDIPSRPEIDAFIASFQQEYAWYDNAITAMISAFPRNDSYTPVINKVVVINRLYSTNIWDISGMASKIMELDFDTRAEAGDLTLVHDIASANPKYSNNRNYNYSFATKYCNWHAQQTYPIFDSVVRWYVARLNRAHQFSDVKVKDYWDYPSWKQIIDDITARMQVTDLRYKQADKLLWALGQSEEQSQ